MDKTALTLREYFYESVIRGKAHNLDAFEIVGTARNSKDHAGLLKILRDEGCDIDHNSLKAFGRLSLGQLFGRARIPTSTVVVSLRDLGFGQDIGKTREAIYTRASELGLGICPDWIVPLAGLAYSQGSDQILLRIATIPIRTSKNRSGIFILWRPDGWSQRRSLATEDGGTNKYHSGDWIFMAPEGSGQ